MLRREKKSVLEDTLGDHLAFLEQQRWRLGPAGPRGNCENSSPTCPSAKKIGSQREGALWRRSETHPHRRRSEALEEALVPPQTCDPGQSVIEIINKIPAQNKKCRTALP